MQTEVEHGQIAGDERGEGQVLQECRSVTSEGSRARSRGGTRGPWNPWDPAKDMTLPPQGSGGLTKAASRRRTPESHTEDTDGCTTSPPALWGSPSPQNRAQTEPRFA